MRVRLIVLMLSFAYPYSAMAQDSESTDKEPREESPLVSPVWKPKTDRLSELGWALLRLPELYMQMLFSPLQLATRAVERYRVDLRVYDFLTNEEKTAHLFPFVDVRGRDGVGYGATFSHKDLYGEGQRIQLISQIRANQDWRASARYKHSFARLEGKEVELYARYKVDRNFPYFGLGGQSKRSDERVLRLDSLKVTADTEIARGLSWSLFAEAAFRRERTSSGTDATRQSYDENVDAFAPPPGYRQTLNLPELTVHALFDTRDTHGRTNRGFAGHAEVSITQDLNVDTIRGWRASGQVATFVPVLPRHRVLVFILGGAFAEPLAKGDDVPLPGLVALGRTNNMRGFERNRFLASKAWWGSTEYRYPIFEYDDTGIGLSSLLFVDVGRAANRADNLFNQTPLVSYGFGIRGESAQAGQLFKLQVGFSKEGVQFVAVAGDDI